MSDDAKLQIFRALFVLYREAQERDVRRWHPDDQAIYRDQPFSLEDRLVLVEQAREGRAFEEIRRVVEADWEEK